MHRPHWPSRTVSPQSGSFFLRCLSFEGQVRSRAAGRIKKHGGNIHPCVSKNTFRRPPFFPPGRPGKSFSPIFSRLRSQLPIFPLYAAADGVVHKNNIKILFTCYIVSFRVRDKYRVSGQLIDKIFSAGIVF